MQPSVLNRRQFSMGIGATALAGFGVARAQSEGRIVLGQSAAFSGPAAQLGIQFNQGAKLFFDQLNAAGGVGKRMVEIRTLDDGYEPDRCAENTRKLIADDVFALFGYVGTPTSLAAVPLFNQAKVPFFAPFTGPSRCASRSIASSSMCGLRTTTKLRSSCANWSIWASRRLPCSTRTMPMARRGLTA